MKRLIYLLFICFSFGASSLATYATSPQQLYAKGDYIGAAKEYETMLAETSKMQSSKTLNANLHYNLGNCYYQTHNYAQAVLNYQRALRLNPADKDASFNLDLTQSKLQDQFTPPSEMFFITWTRMLVVSVSATVWGYWAIFFIVVVAFGWILFRCLKKERGRKISFSVACVSLMCSLFSFLFAYAESNWIYANRQVVVMRPTNVFDSPTQGAKTVKELNEGVLLDVIDEQSGWIMVEMPNGVRAWLKQSVIEYV